MATKKTAAQHEGLETPDWAGAIKAAQKVRRKGTAVNDQRLVGPERVGALRARYRHGHPPRRGGRRHHGGKGVGGAGKVGEQLVDVAGRTVEGTVHVGYQAPRFVHVARTRAQTHTQLSDKPALVAVSCVSNGNDARPAGRPSM